MKGSLFSTFKINLIPSSNDENRLSTLVLELAKLVDAQRLRLEIVDEEACYFKQNYESITREYERIKT